MRTVLAILFLLCCYVAAAHAEDVGYMFLPLVSGALLLGAIFFPEKEDRLL